jgi:hypothetical protein
MLPVPALGTSSVDIDGTPVPFRSLSRDEVVSLSKYGDDTGAAEVFMLSRACDITESEAADWRTKVNAETAGTLLAAIAALSGIGRGEA